MKLRKSKEEIRKLMELRRSNAASAIPNKKRYNRQSNKKMIRLENNERGPND